MVNLCLLKCLLRVGRSIPVEQPGQLAQRFRGTLFRSDGVDVSDNLLPTVAHIPECGVVLREHEAGVYETQPCAAADPGESPGDDRVEARAIVPIIAVMAALPR